MTLRRIDIQLCEYGDNKGKYVGIIEFGDQGRYDKEQFVFRLTPNMCGKYLSLIQDEVINSSKELSDKLVKSFVRELEGPKTTAIGNYKPKP